MTGKPITDLLREMENGQLVEDLTRELHRIVKAVRDTRNSGVLTATGIAPYLGTVGS